MRTVWSCVAAAGLAMGICATANAGGAAVGNLDRGLSSLVKYPGAQAMTLDGRVVSIYGVPMTGGASPQAAAAAFWEAHGADFGVAGVDLRAERTDVIGNGSTVIAYKQYLGGLPVEYGLARIVVHPDGNRVTLASARLAQSPAGGLAAPAMSAAEALASVKASAVYHQLTAWSTPTLVVHDASLSGTGPAGAAAAWKFTGQLPALEDRQVYTFFVDASTGRLLEARNDVLNADITGKVQAKGTPGVKPDSGSNPPVAKNVELVRVTGASSTVNTNASGDYVLPTPGSSAVNVTTTLANGEWVKVVDTSGTAVLSLTQSVTPPGPGNFLLNNTPSEFTTAQVNAFIGTINIHNYFKSRAPAFTGLDIQIPANVNINSSCNAYFDGGSINFYRNQGGCANTAYADVISHEYGHFIVQALGLAQNAFGEGYGDTCGVLLHDVGVIGQDFCGTGCNVRDIDGANKQYPCSGEIHDCGQVVAGVWRDIRLKMTDKYGSAPALEVTRQDQVDWSLITVGQQNDSNGMWPQSGIEVMTVDDDDGNLLNGCPNYAEIKYGFNKHGISVPVIKPVNFSYPAGLPSAVAANAPVPIVVSVVDGSEHSIDNTAQVLYRFSSSDAFHTTPLSKQGDGYFHGTIPGVICGKTGEFKIRINTTETPGGRIDPETGVYSYQVVGTPVLTDDFETTSGFTVSGGAFIGKWNMVDPVGTLDGGIPAQAENAASGAKCWVTGNGAAGGAASSSDLDGGESILTSPVFSLVGVTSPAISYYRWFYNNDSGDSGNYLIVEISSNGGTNWTQVEQIGPGGAGTQGGWVYHSFDPTALTAATANMKLRFRAADKTPDDLVEAGVDAFSVVSNTCSCPADFDQTGFVDTEDFDAYILAFEAGDPSADFDQSGFVDTEDVDAFVFAFELGC